MVILIRKQILHIRKHGGAGLKHWGIGAVTVTQKLNKNSLVVIQEGKVISFGNRRAEICIPSRISSWYGSADLAQQLYKRWNRLSDDSESIIFYSHNDIHFDIDFCLFKYCFGIHLISVVPLDRKSLQKI